MREYALIFVLANMLFCGLEWSILFRVAELLTGATERLV